MHRRDGSAGEVDRQGVMENVNVKVQDVELRGHAADFVEHNEMIRNGISHGRVETQSPFAANVKSSGGDRVAAGEQGHVMALPNQFLGQVGNDSLSSPIQLGRTAFHQRRYLSDLHRVPRSPQLNVYI